VESKPSGVSAFTIACVYQQAPSDARLTVREAREPSLTRSHPSQAGRSHRRWLDQSDWGSCAGSRVFLVAWLADGHGVHAHGDEDVGCLHTCEFECPEPLLCLIPFCVPARQSGGAARRNASGLCLNRGEKNCLTRGEPRVTIRC
jgi:hypothetical protein